MNGRARLALRRGLWRALGRPALGTALAVPGPVASRSPRPSRPHAARNEGDDRGYARHRPEQSVLYRVVQQELEPFLARARSMEWPPPRFVEQELRAYLHCGLLAWGFLRLHCDDCRIDRLVLFSCKRRGFCPSCGGRRMADTAAHLVDCVLPEVPVRQWVLTLPYPLRYRCAYDARPAWRARPACAT